jgi:putative ABC transport system permease protein
MPIAYRERIAQVPGVVDVMPFQWFGGIYKDPKNVFARYAVPPQKLLKVRSELAIPADQQQALLRDKTGCVVGRALADRYGFKLGDRISIEGDIFPVTPELTVRAIYDYPQDNDLLFFNLDYLYELIPTARRDKIFGFLVLVDDPHRVAAVAKEIDAAFRNSTTQTKTEAEQSFMLSFLSLLGNVKLFLVSLCAALSFTILLVSANTMAMSIRERIPEVGVLKTLGFATRTILMMLIGEAVVLSTTGGILGLALAWGLTAWMKGLPALVVNLSTLRMTPQVIAALLAAGVLLGVASCLIPAVGAARKPILVCMKTIE